MIESPPQAANPPNWRQVVGAAFRNLSFRATRDDLISLRHRHLIFGLICTWIVGVGRYWDNQRVGILQHLGVGSVVYVFALALLLWLLVRPLGPKHWTYFRVLTFISLVSPPAILYAVPVEKFFSIETSNSINVWVLAIVATWRVALLVYFLRILAELNWFSVIVAAFLPLTFIVVTLTSLNLERAVFSLMGGLTEHTSNDDAFAALFLLSVIAFLLFIPLLACYLSLALIRLVGNRSSSADRN